MKVEQHTAFSKILTNFATCGQDLKRFYWASLQLSNCQSRQRSKEIKRHFRACTTTSRPPHIKILEHHKNNNCCPILIYCEITIWLLLVEDICSLHETGTLNQRPLTQQPTSKGSPSQCTFPRCPLRRWDRRWMAVKMLQSRPWSWLPFPMHHHLSEIFSTFSALTLTDS